MQNKRQNICIAIDGYAGTGKSSLGKLLATDLNFCFLSTGSLYRAMAYKCLINGVDVHDKQQILDALKDTTVDIVFKDDTPYVVLNGQLIKEELLHTKEINALTPFVAKHQEIREKALFVQQDLVKTKNIVLEGRDIGTVVAPDAEIKLFFTASPEVRAERRLQQHKESGENVGYEEVLQNIIMRDFEDANRKISPLKPAEDAVMIDTSHTTLQDTSKKIYGLVFNKMQQILNSNSDIEVSENLITLNSEKQM